MKYTHKALRMARHYYKTEGFLHSLRVADISLRGLGESLDADRLYAVAILHDIIEDTMVDMDFLRQEMGDEIADSVFLLTKPYGGTYMDYVLRIGLSEDLYAIRVKQADIKDHLDEKDTLTESLKERYVKAVPLLL